MRIVRNYITSLEILVFFKLAKDDYNMWGTKGKYDFIVIINQLTL